jgi:protein gp37
MANNSSIEWTESTWNPVTGCTKMSTGCKHCYAERMAKRLQAMGQANYANGFKVTTHERALELVFKWKTPQVIFVNSMSDLFHKDVPTSFILRVFDVMNEANWHRYQLLTKRSGRLLNLNKQLQWSQHIWMGVSVETERQVNRIEDLRRTGAHVKFVSFEPLLSPIRKLDLTRIDWAIVGGESGPGARPMLEEWALGLRDQCQAASVPFFFKQWGGVQKKKAGRLLQGKIWDEMPSVLAPSV